MVLVAVIGPAEQSLKGLAGALWHRGHRDDHRQGPAVIARIVGGVTFDWDAAILCIGQNY
jgi:hypothetical protein